MGWKSLEGKDILASCKGLISFAEVSLSNVLFRIYCDLLEKTKVSRKFGVFPAPYPSYYHGKHWINFDSLFLWAQNTFLCCTRVELGKKKQLF